MLEVRHVLSTITVTTINDVVDQNDGETSLREAIESANSAGGDTIAFSTDPGDGLNDGTIALDMGLGEISIGKSLTIDASGLSNGITIDAGGGTDTVVGNGDGFRIFDITDPTSGTAPPLIKLIGLTLTGGDVSDDGGATRSAAQLELRDCVIENNHSDSRGGGIFQMISAGTNSFASLNIQDSTISGNTADNGGGGVYARAYAGSSLEIRNSAIVAQYGLQLEGVSKLRASSLRLIKSAGTR